MGRPRKAQVEGAVSTVEVPLTSDGMATAFDMAVASFRALHPDEWEAIRLCATQHGIEIIASKLKG